MIRIDNSQLAHGFLMKRGELPICVLCETYLSVKSVKHIFDESKIYEETKNSFQLVTIFTESLEPHPKNEIKAIKFLQHVDLLNTF